MRGPFMWFDRQAGTYARSPALA